MPQEHVTGGNPSGEEEEEEKIQLLFLPVTSTAATLCLIKPSPCNKTASISYDNKEKAVQAVRN